MAPSKSRATRKKKRKAKPKARRSMIIAVTGTPGAGKSTLARGIAERLSGIYLDVNVVIAASHLSEGFDRSRKCKIIDVRRLVSALSPLVQSARRNKQVLVIDSHLSHYLPPRLVDLCVVAKCELGVLKKRLKKRGYSSSKIRENLDCEIFDLCLMEAVEVRHKVIAVDCTCPLMPGVMSALARKIRAMCLKKK